jgi:dTDP-4-amino-4,6-dideoxygalactose transaminase
MEIAQKHHLYVVEDAAQAVDSFYVGRDGARKALGSIGHLAAFSFHETKNIIAGEGGMLVVNDEQFMSRAEIIWEKGTNRSAFFRGEVDKYNWVDMGSSFLPSEIVAAFLYAQLEHLDEIQTKRIRLWNQYQNGLQTLQSDEEIGLPFIPQYAGNNAHLFYLLFANDVKRDQTINFLKSKHILSVFHYLSLHQSPFYQPRHDGRQLVNANRYSNTLLRLPMYYELTHEDIESIIREIKNSIS